MSLIEPSYSVNKVNQPAVQSYLNKVDPFERPELPPVSDKPHRSRVICPDQAAINQNIPSDIAPRVVSAALVALQIKEDTHG